MAQPEVLFFKNDMLLRVSGVRSSTMASTAYLNSSTGMTVSIYDGETTSAQVLINGRNCAYVTASNGQYQAVAQSTETTALSVRARGLALFVLSHSGLNAEWRVPFRVDYRRTT